MKILIIEDDKELCKNMKEHLSNEGYLVDICFTGEEGMFYALNNSAQYDFALIDRMLPIIDGLTIIKSMRKKQINVPIIIITGMSQIQDKIDGLDSGSDDYLVKPFHLSELSARIRALTRRPIYYTEHNALNYADLSLDCEKKELSCREQKITLTPKEYALMYSLLKRPDALHSREQLLSYGWENDNIVEPGNVDNYIYFLRKRLRSLKSTCKITSIYGSGYKLEATYDS